MSNDTYNPIPMASVQPGTLVDILRWRASHQPDRHAYTFLIDGEEEGGYLTYAQLDQKARAIAATIQQYAQPGERALLLYPSGLDYIAAYMGCLYAGIIAVPAYPPSSRRSFGRIQAISTDCQAILCLTIEQTRSRFFQWRHDLPEMDNMHWLVTDTTEQLLAEDYWQEYSPPVEALAFLQYTSGSTGTPKGVMVSHGNLMHNLSAIKQTLNLSTQDICVSWLPIFHDMGLIAGILLALYSGFPTILMAPAAFVQRPLRWLTAISRYKGTISYAPNFAYELCNQRVTQEERVNLNLSSWRSSCNGAEPIRKESIDRFNERFSPCGLRKETVKPAYGLAEGTLMVSCTPADVALEFLYLDKDQLKHHHVLSRPEANEETTLLVGNGPVGGGQHVVIAHPDTHLRCHPGEVGEIWIAGPSVAQGYWQKPTETQETFLAFLQDTGEGPFLRTGDLGFLHGREVYVTGRLKDIMIIRGRNHYPQDLEQTVEQAHPSLRPGCGAAFVIDEMQEEKLVVINEVLRDHTDVQEIFQAIRQAIAEEHELQAHTILLIRYSSILKTSSGKIQRRACREAFLAGNLLVIASDVRKEETQLLHEKQISRTILLGQPFEEQAKYIQTYLMDRLQEIAHISSDYISPQIALSAIGLDSLQAAQLKTCIEDDLAVTTSLTEFMQETSIAELSGTILTQLKSEEPENMPSLSPITSAESSTCYPLSLAQEQLWILNQLEPESSFYTITVGLELKGQINIALLEYSLQEVVRRHALLRTTFHEQDGMPLQSIHADIMIKPITIDLRDIPNAEERPEVARRLAEITTQQPFDLTRIPLWRLFLLHVEEQSSILLIMMHHIISDGWSTGLLLQELTSIYRAQQARETVPLFTLRAQYSDYINWQYDWARSTAYATQLAYWQRQLHDLAVLELPTDRRHPTSQRYRGAIKHFTITSELKQQCKALSNEESATLFMLFMAAFQVLLFRYTGQKDIIVGTVAANRPTSALRQVIGYFVNTLIIRSQCTGSATFREFLSQIRKICLEAYTHQDLPFTRLVEELKPIRDPGRNPLFQVMFTWQPDILDGLYMPDLTLHNYKIGRTTSKFDLTIDMIEGEEKLEGIVEYNTDLFDAITIERLIKHYNILLESIVNTPDKRIAHLPLLTHEEQNLMLAEPRIPEPIASSPSLWTLFEEQVQKTPDTIATICGMEQLTYYKLYHRSLLLAAYLRVLGIKPGRPVGICMERSLDLMVSLFGVLRAGGTYVPLDPDYPQERIAYMMADAQVQTVITHSTFVGHLPDIGISSLCLDTRWPQIEPQKVIEIEWYRPEIETSLLYIIYTSGSTGQAKGAGVYVHSFVNLLRWYTKEFQLARRDRSLIISSFSFDLTQKNFFACLLVGGSIALLPSPHYEVELITQCVQEQAITRLNCTPSAFYPLVTMPQTGTRAWWSSLRTVFLGGEPIALQQLRDWLSNTEIELVNTYGPTECTDVASYYRLTDSVRLLKDSQPVPIGSAIWQAQLLVLNKDLNLIPSGTVGELYIRGICLGAGYVHDGAQTASRFLPDPFATQPGQRIYQTGDLVRYRNDGSLEFHGRIDHQVKVRGFRINLEEIEHTLDEHAAIQKSVVLVREDVPGNAYLVAYVVPKAESHTIEREQKPFREQVYSYLKDKLTAYMLPSYIVILKEFPLTLSGKLHPQALPPPTEQIFSEEVVAPRTVLEEMLSRHWQQVLSVRQIGIHDNFFQSGGHSLLGTQLISRIKHELRVEVSLRHLFEAPTIAQLAVRIQNMQQQKEAIPELPPLIPQVRPSALPLSFAQQRLWFLYQLTPQSVAYATPLPIHVRGPLQIEAVEHSLAEIIQRHEILRTNIVLQHGQPVQHIHATRLLALPIIDLQGLPMKTQKNIVEQINGLDTQRPFNLADDVLFRAWLLRLQPEEYVMALTIHHIIFDGWSQWVFLNEFARHYEAFNMNPSAPLPDLPVQYADFALWQRAWLRDSVLEEHLQYWTKQLRGAQSLEMPTDFPRPTTLKQQGASYGFHLSPQVTTELKRLSQQEGVTFFTTLLSAWQVFLHRYTDQEDIVIGTDIANRTNIETEALIGFFVNLLAVRTNFAGKPTFRAMLRNMHETVLEAYAHQDLPFEKVIDALQLERVPGHLPLIRVLFVFQNIPDGATQVRDIILEPQVVGVNTAKFDLAFFLWEKNEQLIGGFNYSTALFKHDTIKRMAQLFEELLSHIIAQSDKEISQLEFTTKVEKEHLQMQYQLQRDTRRKKLKLAKRQEIPLSQAE